MTQTSDTKCFPRQNNLSQIKRLDQNSSYTLLSCTTWQMSSQLISFCSRYQRASESGCRLRAGWGGSRRGHSWGKLERLQQGSSWGDTWLNVDLQHEGHRRANSTAGSVILIMCTNKLLKGSYRGFRPFTVNLYIYTFYICFCAVWETVSRLFSLCPSTTLHYLLYKLHWSCMRPRFDLKRLHHHELIMTK